MGCYSQRNVEVKSSFLGILGALSHEIPGKAILNGQLMDFEEVGKRVKGWMS